MSHRFDDREEPPKYDSLNYYAPTGPQQKVTPDPNFSWWTPTAKGKKWTKSQLFVLFAGTIVGSVVIAGVIIGAMSLATNSPPSKAAAAKLNGVSLKNPQSLAIGKSQKTHKASVQAPFPGFENPSQITSPSPSAPATPKPIVQPSPSPTAKPRPSGSSPSTSPTGGGSPSTTPVVCPSGDIGTPPDCQPSPPPPSPTCTPPQVGTPPNCMDPPPSTCPPPQIGTPPNCTDPTTPPVTDPPSPSPTSPTPDPDPSTGA